jgi:hypothetical protein
VEAAHTLLAGWRLGASTFAECVPQTCELFLQRSTSLGGGGFVLGLAARKLLGGGLLLGLDTSACPNINVLCPSLTTTTTSCAIALADGQQLV